MSQTGYTPEQLRTQRASLFLFGGSLEDRRSWAEHAADQFPEEGPLRILQSLRDLPAFLTLPRGVVFVPDVLALDWEAQAQILHCLRFQEERAKWVLGLGASPQGALEEGRLRPDLWHRLRIAQLDVQLPEVQVQLKQRRARPPAHHPVGAPKPPSRNVNKIPGKKVRRA